MRFSDANIKRICIVLLVAYAVILAWLSLTPGSDSTPYFPHDDKVMHFFAYCLFSLMCIAFMETGFSTVIVALAVFFFGVFMEIGQSFVPMREPSFLDLLANTLGMLVGVFWAQKLRLIPALQKIL